MPNRSEMERIIARDLARKDLNAFPFSELAAALAAANPGKQNAIEQSINRRRNARLGSLILEVVLDYLETSRTTEAAAMLQDDSLSLPELSRWLD